LGSQTSVCRMPHEKTRDGLLSDSCKFALDRRRALTLSPEIRRDSCQSESPLKIPRRVSTAEDECVDTEMSKDWKKSHSKIHWTQLASNGTSSQSDPKSQKNFDQWKEIYSRQVMVVLEDVLQTEIGQRLLRCGGQSCQKTNHSESKRQSDHTSTAALKDKRRTSLTKREEKDSAGPKATSPSHNQTESSAENESRLHKEIQIPKSKQLNSSLKLLEASEVSGNSCSPRESDSPQAKQTKPSTFEENEVLLLEGSPQHEEALSSGCEFICSPSSLLATRGSLKEEKSGSEHLANKKERRETQESPKYASENKENHLLRNGEVVQEVDGMRGSVLRLSVGVDGEIPVKRCRMGSLSGEHVPNSDPASGRTEGWSFIIESSKISPFESIVLSSEEEEEEEGEERKELNASAPNIQPLEGAKDMNIVDKSSSAEMELQLSSLHMGGVSAPCESMKITTDKITFSFKDSSVNISVLTASVCKYSVWEEPVLKGCGLVKENEVPPPYLVFLWLSEAQAHQLHNDLSVILPGTCPAESSRCVLLCLDKPVTGVESAVLASLMDIVGLNQNSSELHSPLTQPESLKLLQSSQETHLLQLLMPETDPQTSTAAHAAGSAVKSQDSEIQSMPYYTLCHRRAQGSYSVTLAPTLGAEWTPLIQFPPPPSKGAITVTTEDLECLDSGEFLNDVIIDFYLKYLLVQRAPQASVDRSHVFSSFFYKQLTRRDNANEDSTSTPAQVRRHQRVRTWTRHVDIFDKDFLFVPVNQEAHWYLVVICFPGLEEPQYVKRDGSGFVQGRSEGEIHGENRSSSDEDKDNLHMHSNSRTLSLCRTVRKIPARDKLCVKEQSNRVNIFLTQNFKNYFNSIFFQTMYSHHGFPEVVCSRTYLQTLARDPVLHFDLPLRLDHWFSRQKVRGKREEIRDLILHLYRFQQGSLGNEALEDRTDYGINVIQ
ncbi:hypothetical protein cypCar_00032704, partial [Cyprinus carpio]